MSAFRSFRAMAGNGSSLPTSGHSGDAQIVKIAAQSIADEIVGPDGMAQIRPAPHFPVIDDTDIAHQCFEAFRLAHWREGRMPEHVRIETSQVIGPDIVFKEFNNTARHRVPELRIERRAPDAFSDVRKLRPPLIVGRWSDCRPRLRL